MTTTLFDKLVPEIVKDCELEANPVHEIKADKLFDVLIVGTPSLSVIVTVHVAFNIEVFIGSVIETVKFSVDSGTLSLIIVIVIVCEVWPGAKVTVPVAKE